MLLKFSVTLIISPLDLRFNTLAFFNVYNDSIVLKVKYSRLKLQ